MNAKLASSLAPAHGSDVERRFCECAPNAVSARQSFEIVTGTFADYQSLARFHYIAARPATLVRVLCARDARDHQPIGVLVVSMPTLDGSWRKLAWPGRYQSRDRAAAAQRVNRELRTISRVIVDPRYRGVGLARSLVETYLADPLTPATEAIAAMGAVSPFFRAAGMQEYRLPMSPANAKLRDAMHACGIAPSSLCRSACAHRALKLPLFARELRHWSRSRKDTRTLDDLGQILPFATRAMLSDPRAYAHTRAPIRDR